MSLLTARVCEAAAPECFPCCAARGCSRSAAAGRRWGRTMRGRRRGARPARLSCSFHNNQAVGTRWGGESAGPGLSRPPLQTRHTARLLSFPQFVLYSVLIKLDLLQQHELAMAWGIWVPLADLSLFRKWVQVSGCLPTVAAVTVGVLLGLFYCGHPLMCNVRCFAGESRQTILTLKMNRVEVWPPR